jgi:hypothetical protein
MLVNVVNIIKHWKKTPIIKDIVPQNNVLFINISIPDVISIIEKNKLVYINLSKFIDSLLVFSDITLGTLSDDLLIIL